MVEGTPFHIDDLIIASYNRLLPRIIKEILDLGVDADANEIAEIAEIAKEVFEKLLPCPKIEHVHILREDIVFAINHKQTIDYACADIFNKRVDLLCSLIIKIGNVDVYPGELRSYATIILGKLFNDIHNEVKTKRASIDEYFSIIKR